MSPSQPPSSPSQTQSHCPTCRRPDVDTDVGDVLERILVDLKHLHDLVEEVTDALAYPFEESDDEAPSAS